MKLDITQEDIDNAEATIAKRILKGMSKRELVKIKKKLKERKVK